MSFRLTARDLGGANGGADGGTAFADTTLTVGTAGPFLVTSQAGATSVAGGSSGTVAWNVAGTGTSTYATNVKISFSTDGGLTFPTVLAASTPNDGSENLTWPNVATSQGRFKVEAVDNYFYDVNDGPITISPTSGPTPTLTVGGNAAGQTFTAASSDPLTSTPTISAESNTVAGSAITMSATGLPDGLSLGRTATTATGTTYAVSGKADADAGSYPVTVVVSDGAGNADNATVTFTVTVTKDTATLTYTGETAGTTGTRTVSVSLADTDATPGTVTGTVAFTDQTTGATLCTATVTAGSPSTASCTFSAPAARTYQVVGTLTGPRYSGASAPAGLVVSVPATLTTGGNAAGETFTAASSDPLATTPVVTAEASAVDGTDLTAEAVGLPDGLTLTRTATSAAGTRPGTARFEVTGTADADPGRFPVTVTVTDGPGGAADRTVDLTILVERDDATVSGTSDSPQGVGSVTLSATVADTDATPGTVEGSVAFTDRATGEALCSAPVEGDGATCDATVTTERTLQVVATLTSTRYSGASGASPVVVVLPPPTDTTAPETTVTGGPAQSATVLTRDLVYTFASSEAGSTFDCRLNGSRVECPSGRVSLSDLPGGTYDLYVAAVDEAGNTDASPVRRRFYVPVDDARLRVVKGSWKRVAASGYFRSTYVGVSQRTATLSYQVTGATSLSLVLSNASTFGSVDVFLGEERLATISARGTATRQRVAAIDSFATPRSGLLRIVSRTDAEVRIDGLVVRTKDATGSARRDHRLAPGAL